MAGWTLGVAVNNPHTEDNEMSADGWNEVYITDKTGKRFWKTTASPMATQSEINNLKRHLDRAMLNPGAYKMLDVPSAVVMLNGEPVKPPEISEDDLALLSDLFDSEV